MPKGLREQFSVELVPDFDQRKKWASLKTQAEQLSSLFREEIERQIQVLGAPVAKVFYMETKSGEGLAPDIVEPARSRIREQVYDNFRTDLSPGARLRARRSVKYSLEVRGEDVHFSVERMSVRIPYLGLVHHRKNKHILAVSEGANWSMANTTSMRLVVKSRHLCLVIDTREDPSLKTKKKPPAQRKSSKWLT
jgi:hypothetical protein